MRVPLEDSLQEVRPSVNPWLRQGFWLSSKPTFDSRATIVRGCTQRSPTGEGGSLVEGDGPLKLWGQISGLSSGQTAMRGCLCSPSRF